MSFFRFLALADIIQTVRQSHNTTDTMQGPESVLPLLQSLRSPALSDSLDTLAVTCISTVSFCLFLSVDISKNLPISHHHVFILNKFTWALTVGSPWSHPNCSLLDIFDTWILFYSLHVFKHSPDLPLHVIRLWMTVHVSGLEVVLRFVAGLVLILFLSAAELGQTGACVCACRQKQAITTLSGLRSPQLFAVSH